MIGLSSHIRVFVCPEPVDMRNSLDGLSARVQLTMRESPASGHLFLFVSRGRDRVKVLYYERNGFCLWYKRLERGRFPSIDQLCAQGFDLSELLMWLDGVEVSRVKRLAPVSVGCVA
jgi:transposase